MKIKLITCVFAKASQLFKGYEFMFDGLVESEPSFSWGDNDRSIVLASRIIYQLEHVCNETKADIKEIKKRIKDNSIKFVDLEN